jgi:LysR family hydrogen peroxide-inducible transcriptional activator
MERIDRLESLLIRDLRALITLAERQNFAVAAEEFGISQPSMSAIVKKVEAAFEVEIFARSSRRFAVTPDGDAILRQIRVVLEELNHLANTPVRDAPPLVGPFRLGIIPTLGPYYLPHVLGSLCTAFPNLELALIETKSEPLLYQLRQRDLDAALMALPVEAPDMEAYPLFRETFLLAAPEGHKLCEEAEIEVIDLDLREMLMLERGNCLRDQILSACGSNRPGEGKPIHATSLETLRYMVAARLGITLFPALAAPHQKPSIPAVHYLPFAPPIPGRTIGLVTRKHSTRTLDVHALADFLRANLPQAVSAEG